MFNNNRYQFEFAQDHLQKNGFICTNPIDIMETYPKYNERQIMSVDIAALFKCDYIAMLPGWRESKGATTEILIAHRYGLKIIDAYTLEPIDVMIELNFLIPKK